MNHRYLTLVCILVLAGGCARKWGRERGESYSKPEPDLVLEKLVAEARQTAAESNAQPDDVDKQSRAIDTASRLYAYLGGQDAKEEAWPTIQPVIDRAFAGANDCDAKLRLTMIYRGGGAYKKVTESYLGTARACIRPEDISYVVLLFDPVLGAYEARSSVTCDDLVQLAEDLWPLASNRDSDQIKILDMVMRCSTAYTARRNFAFVPPEVLADYAAVLRERERDDAAKEVASSMARNREQCDTACMEYYGLNGVCLGSCGGDTSCVRACEAGGRTCHARCE